MCDPAVRFDLLVGEIVVYLQCVQSEFIEIGECMYMDLSFYIRHNLIGFVHCLFEIEKNSVGRLK